MKTLQDHDAEQHARTQRDLREIKLALVPVPQTLAELIKMAENMGFNR